VWALSWELSSPQRRPQLLTVVGENLGIVCAARDGNIGHAVVDQVFGVQFGIDVDQHPVGGLALAGMTPPTVRIRVGLSHSRLD